MPTVLEAIALQCFGVAPVSLTVTGGQCLAVAGRSGSGKSLLLRMIADLVPHSGECRLDGVPASAIPAPLWRSQVRYAASEPGWWAPTIGEHFRDLATLADQAAQLGLPQDAITAPPERLSTGERQRFAFLRAIAERPKVLLLDEPSSALDHEATLALEGMVHALMADGLAVILVSHHADQIARLAGTTLTIGDAA